MVSLAALPRSSLLTHSRVCSRSFLARMWSALSVWQQYFEGRRALASLDSRMLEDIGLTQRQIRQELSKPLWRV